MWRSFGEGRSARRRSEKVTRREQGKERMKGFESEEIIIG
jgi:hypothetical protein